MNQFIKVDNEKIKKKEPICYCKQLGLYMLISAFLSNPSFKEPAGGFKSAVLKHCKNKYYSFNKTWQELGKLGFLKRNRMPVAENYFFDFYQLLDIPDNINPSVINMTAKQGREFLENAPIKFIIPKTNYTAISYNMLMDENISLSAKGLFAVIQRLILMAQNTPDMIITKPLIRKICKEGNFAFNTLWNELKVHGYLTLKRVWDPDIKKIRYIYSLSGSPDNQTENKHKEIHKDKTTEKPSRKPYKAITDNRHINIPPKSDNNIKVITKREYDDIKKDVLEQINYDWLSKTYNINDLNNIVNIITNIRVADDSKTLSINGVIYNSQVLRSKFMELTDEHIQYVLDSFYKASKSHKIHNVKSYIETTLFNSLNTIDLQTSADVRTYGLL